MSIEIRGKSDSSIDQLLLALAKYDEQHPRAQIMVYRQNSVSIRVRILDPDFAGIARADRHEVVWSFLAHLPEEVQSQVSLLLLLTPEETKRSLANLEFDNPTPSLIR